MAADKSRVKNYSNEATYFLGPLYVMLGVSLKMKRLTPLISSAELLRLLSYILIANIICELLFRQALVKGVSDIHVPIKICSSRCFKPQILTRIMMNEMKKRNRRIDASEDAQKVRGLC